MMSTTVLDVATLLLAEITRVATDLRSTSFTESLTAAIGAGGIGVAPYTPSARCADGDAEAGRGRPPAFAERGRGGWAPS